jgi:hypothetical protein
VKAVITAGDNSSYTSFQFSCRNTFIWLPATDVVYCNWRATAMTFTWQSWPAGKGWSFSVWVTQGWHILVVEKLTFTLSDFLWKPQGKMTRGSWVGVGTLLTAERPGVSFFGRGSRLLFLAKCRWAVGPTQLSYSVGTVSSFPGAKGTEGLWRETHHSASSTDVVKTNGTVLLP